MTNSCKPRSKKYEAFLNSACSSLKKAISPGFLPSSSRLCAIGERTSDSDTVDSALLTSELAAASVAVIVVVGVVTAIL
jgi:hypothetical protein